MSTRGSKSRALFACALLAALLAISLAAAPAPARADQAVYTDSLQNGWQNYSWAATDLASTTSPHTGSDAIAVTTGAYQALYLHHAGFSSSPYLALTFWINGGASGTRSLHAQATLNGVAQPAVALPAPTANGWTLVTLPLSALGAAGQTTLDGFWIQDASGIASTTPFYVDDIAFTTQATGGGPVTLSVDAAAGHHPISPLIYGVAYGDTAALNDLNAPLNRQGGNNTSRYNWQLNADNKDADFFFESIPDADPTPGGRGDAFIAGSQAGGAQALLTIPMIGWVANVGPGRTKLASFSVAKYGPQQATDFQWMPDAGNGLHVDGTPVTGNDPNDADVPDSAAIEAGWMSHLTGKWGTADKGGLKYYILDNEPSIWHSTHRDVHPTGATMDEIKNDILTYGAKVHAADPAALVVAPEEWGWNGYFYSGFDQQYGSLHGWSSLPDRAAHGGMDYVPYLLQQVQQHDQAAGQRTLDVFSLHFYPQGGEFGDTVTDSMALLRNRSTRQLWDPAYTSESWIKAPVQLIPRMKGWVNTYYPGTKTALTEYNWGAEGNVNGATTQADVYGIFGREGLDMATRWTTPATNSPVYQAMKMFRNYDGLHSGFGDVSVSDAAPDPDTVSSFAALRSSDGALTVLVINKGLSAAAPVSVNVSNFSPGPAAQAWQLTSSNTITRVADVPTAGGALSLTVPAQSITLFVVPAAATPPTVATPASAGTSPVTGTTTTLSVLGADAGGEGMLTYTWAATGTPPAPVTFSANGTNAAKSSVATFTQAGTYTLTAMITNAQALTVTSSVIVTVSQTPAAVAVAPATAVLAAGQTQQLTATATDQFGSAFSVPPAFTWAVSGVGAVSSTGLFTAGTSPGSASITAAAAAATSPPAAVTVTAAAASQLTFSRQPVGATVGATLTPSVTVQVADAYGNPIVGAALTLALAPGGVLGGTPTQTTNGAGTATFADLSVAASGTYTLTATLSSPALSATSSVFTISPLIVTTLSGSAASGSPGQTVTLKATLKRASGGTPVAAETVSFTVDGVAAGTAVTSSLGLASLTYVIPAGAVIGSAHPVSAAFAGDGSFSASTGKTTLTVTKYATSLSVLSATVMPGQTVTLSATLKSGSTGLAGATVTFTVDGAAVGTGVTNASGLVTLAYTIAAGATVGSHPMTASFAGDASYLAATGKGTLTVKNATALSVSSVTGTHGTSVTLPATLTTGGTGLGGKTVTFKVDGKAAGSAVTDSTGTASLPYAIPATSKPGSHPVSASFAGDATNNAAVGAGTLTVN